MPSYFIALLVAVPLAALWFVVDRIRRRRLERETRAAFAALHSLRLDPGQSRHDPTWVGQTPNGHRVVVRYESSLSEGDEKRWTEVRVPLEEVPASLNFRAAILPWRVVRLLGLALRGTGDPEFDHRIVTWGREQEAAHFLNPARREILLRHLPGWPWLAVGKGAVVARRRGWPRDVARVDEMWQAVTGLAAALVPRGSWTDADLPDAPGLDAGDTPSGRFLSRRAFWAIAATIAVLAVVPLFLFDHADRRPSSPARSPQTILSSLYYWEIHPDDRARVVEQLVPVDRSRPVALSVPYQLKDAQSTEPIVFGARLTSDKTSVRSYRGREYTVRELHLVLSRGSEEGGYDVTLTRPPHLHVQGDRRLLSIGVEPAPRYERRIEAVALPSGTEQVTTRDLQPFDTVERGDWTVRLYDVTNLAAHGSIHVGYRPGPDSPSLPLEQVLALARVAAPAERR